MKSLKSFFIGASVMFMNIGVAFSQLFRPERCTGGCGNCNFSCVSPIAGLVGMGALVIIFKKIKNRFKHKNKISS